MRAEVPNILSETGQVKQLPASWFIELGIRYRALSVSLVDSVAWVLTSQALNGERRHGVSRDHM